MFTDPFNRHHDESVLFGATVGKIHDKTFQDYSPVKLLQQFCGIWQVNIQKPELYAPVSQVQVFLSHPL